MASRATTATFTLHIDAGPDVDPEELDQLTRQLLAELRELEVESAELVTTEAVPSGTKAGEPITLGALVMTVLPSVLPNLLGFLQNWAGRGENRRVKIKTQVGDRAVEVEYSPQTLSVEELKTVIETLTGVLTSGIRMAKRTDAPKVPMVYVLP